MTMLYSHTGVLARTQKSREWMDLEMVPESEVSHKEAKVLAKIYRAQY